MAKQIDQETLNAAIAGYQYKIGELQGKLAELQRLLGGRAPRTSATPRRTGGAQRKRTMSAEARKKLSLAARQRWARLKKTNPGARTLGG